MQCPSCGADNPASRRFCVGCGAELRPEHALAEPNDRATATAAIAPRRVGTEPGLSAGRRPRPKLEYTGELKSPAVAALLGLIPGVGQMYVGQPAKGATLLVASATAYIVLGIMSWGLFCVCVAPIVPFLSAFDAALIARRVNDGEQVSPWQFF